MESYKRNNPFLSTSKSAVDSNNINQQHNQKRKSQVFIAAKSLNDELISLKSLKRMSIGSIDDLDTRDVIFSQYNTFGSKNGKVDLNPDEQNSDILQTDANDLRQAKRLTIDSSQYPDFYDTYNDENISSDEDNSEELSEQQNNLTTVTSIENSYNITSAEYLDENNATDDSILGESKNLDVLDNNKNSFSDGESDEDKEFTSSLLWVPANKHPSIKPDKYLKYVQGKLEVLNTSSENATKRTNKNFINRSRSSNIEESTLRRNKSLQESEVNALSYASRSKSLTRKPSRLRRSYVSDSNDENLLQELDTGTVKKSASKSRFSLKEITEELSKMSQNAGFSGNDAVSLARSLSMSINNQDSSYEDDLDFENDNYFDSELANTSHESDEASVPISPTSPTSPSAYILKSNSIDLFSKEIEKSKRKKGKYQPSYELQIQSETYDTVENADDDDDYVIDLGVENSDNVGRNVTRGKTIKQILQQQQKEIEVQLIKDKAISNGNKDAVPLQEYDNDNDDDDDNYASSFNKQEMKIPKNSSLQRSKFNTYREKSFKKKIHNFNKLKNSKSYDGLTVSTQNLINLSNTSSPTSEKSIAENRNSSYDNISSSDTGSMHTAEDSISPVADPYMENRKASISSESLPSSHSSGSIKLRMKTSFSSLSGKSELNEPSSIDSHAKKDKTEDGKKKVKFYNILKKSAFKFNKTKEQEEDRVAKKLTIDTNVDSKSFDSGNNSAFSSTSMSPEGNIKGNTSPSLPIKLPTFSSKRTLSGSKSKPSHAAENIGLEVNETDIISSPNTSDPLYDLNQQLLFTENKRDLDLVTADAAFKINTIDDAESVMSPLSPSELNMFLEDFDMSDEDVQSEEQALLISHEEIETKDESFSSIESSIFRKRTPSTSSQSLKPLLFAGDNDGNYTSGKKLFNLGGDTVNSVSSYSISAPLTPPETPPKLAHLEDELDSEYDNGDHLPPRKLTFRDVHRPIAPNSPMKYRDSSFGFPLPPLTLSTVIMFDHRLPVSMERAIYRLSHMKLSENKRELRQQVLLSNFMYSYLNLVNHSLYLQKLQEEEAVL